MSTQVRPEEQPTQPRFGPAQERATITYTLLVDVPGDGHMTDEYAWDQIEKGARRGWGHMLWHVETS